MKRFVFFVILYLSLAVTVSASNPIDAVPQISDMVRLPVINVNGSFTPFSTIVGTPSAVQSVEVSGSYMYEGIHVGAVAGFEYSTTGGGQWTSSLSLPTTYNGRVYVRLTGETAGSYNGNVAFTSMYATEVDRAVIGTVNTPVLNVTGSFSPFSTDIGTPSAPQSVVVSGSHLISNINIAAVNGYEYSTSSEGTWTSSLSLPPTFNGDVFVRLTGETQGIFDGNISFTSTSVAPTSKVVSGEVIVPMIEVLVKSNVPGVQIYIDGVNTGFTTEHVFTLPCGSYVFGVMDIETQVTPSTMIISESGTYEFDYTNPVYTEGGGPARSTLIMDNSASCPISVPNTGSVAVTGIAGPVSNGGVIVFTEYTPSTGSVFTYHGYQNVVTVYQAWVSDSSILNGGTISFAYDPSLNYKYVAIHWGGSNNGFYPVNHPDTGYVPTQGYAFNGGSTGQSSNNYTLGMAPFTGSSYSNGILTIRTIPGFETNGEATFELILSSDYDLPVELSSFTATSSTTQLLVNLQWVTESETNNLGFNILRSNNESLATAINQNAHLIQGTNTSSNHTYNFNDDNNIEASRTYYYWLENVDYNGTSTFRGPVLVNVLEQGDPGTLPVIPVEAIQLNNAYPNPFNPETNISFDLQTESFVNITIYNVKGQKIMTLTSQDLYAGHHHLVWNGSDENGNPVGSGVYFYRMIAGKFDSTKKIVLVK